MIKHYLRPTSENTINTSDVYECLTKNRKFLPKSIFIDGKMEIGEVLVNFKEPQLKFSRENMEYIKGKYLQFVSKTEKGEMMDLDFFIESNHTYKPASFLEKILDENRKRGIDNIDIADFENNFDYEYTEEELEIQELHRWAYDIYTYEQKCELTLRVLKEDFEIVIAYYLLFLEPPSFSKQYLCGLFDTTNYKDVSRQLQLMEIKYSEILHLNNWPLKLKYFENSPEVVIELKGNIETSNLIVDEVSHANSKPGRSVSNDFLVNKPIGRSRRDKITKLSAKETAYLFRFFRRSKLIIKDSKVLSNTNLSRLIACLAGYGAASLMPFLSSKQTMDVTSLKNIKKELEDVIWLINRSLS
ncbi:hypothetical protein [Arcticibacterium luteifluviistationis]|uniref:Uncharacterized protein n=1 Tax=Arcticibacterium luteifluviistationis TaxID=1784714 RepID=A0A2Z4GB15_9BACT|nr:hypothetical protein [Arcticibacterium luteifluviistationis]AWV98479.1 hypothetical protein DJ013_09970 [Arcticibacterium luteifluviistationis]